MEKFKEPATFSTATIVSQFIFLIIFTLPKYVFSLEKFINIENFGQIQGEQLRDVQQYLNIPYANPIGTKKSHLSDRFAQPKPFEKPIYENTVNFGLNRLKCHGLYANEHEDEDCLRLSVWTPNHSKKVPILVFLDSRDIMYHTWGQVPNNALLQSVLLNGTFLASYSRSMIIVANFRNGPQGFLQLDKALFGQNVGLSDVKMALNWVQNFAHLFGADPTKMTLMAVSSGVPVAIQLLLEDSSLAQRLILLSGNPLARQTMFKTEQTTAKVLDKLGCGKIYSETKEETKSNLDDCLKKVSVLDLNRISREMKMFDDYWSPESEKIVRQSLARLSKIDILIGINTNSGAYFSHQVRPEIDFKPEVNFYTVEDFESDVKSLICDSENLNGIQCDFIKHEYFNMENQNYETASARFAFLSSMLMDKKLVLPINEFFENLEKFAYKRPYLFTLDRVSPLDLTFGALEVNGSAMGGELQYLFGMPKSVFVDWDSVDREIMARMMDMLNKFIHTG